ncbi:major facilitator superfamily MFS_1 [Hydrogenimonas sp.]|nr:major facilitator superfamily MFS_1 [Hydrogenimonas sp.]
MKKIDRNVVLLGWVSFFTDMASAMINPILPIFVVTILHEGMDKLGIIVAVATFVSYALRLLSGYISDRYGVVKPLVVGGYALSALSKPLIGFTHGYKSVAGLKALERLGKGLRSAPKDLMIAHYSKKRSSGRTFGFHKTLDIAGELSGTLILLGLLYFLGESENVIRNIFFATLVPGLVGLFIVAFLVKDISQKRSDSKKRFTLTERDWSTVRSLFFYFFFLFFIFSEAFFTMQAKSVGIAVVMIPLLFVVSTSVQTLTSYLLGVWVDRIGAGKILAFAYLCGAAAQGLLYLQKPVFTWLSYALLGLFTVASLNANRALIAQKADNRGSVYGIFYAAVALFGAAGAYVSGMIWEHFGIDSALLFGLAGTASMALLYLLFGRYRNE